MLRDRPGEAMAILQRLRREYPDEPVVLNNLANALDGRGWWVNLSSFGITSWKSIQETVLVSAVGKASENPSRDSPRDLRPETCLWWLTKDLPKYRNRPHRLQAWRVGRRGLLL